MKPREQALLLRELASQPPAVLAGTCQRLYIGDEFCERRLPSPALLGEAAAWAAANGRGLTLVTPCLLSDEGIRRLSGLLDLLPEKEGFELVVNDWGLLALANGSYKGRFRLLLGRLLMSKTSGESLSRDFLGFVRARGIAGLEFNTLPFSELLRSQLREYGLACHLYLPYRYVAVTRFCTCANGYALTYRDATREDKGGGGRGRTPHDCGRGCLDHYSALNAAGAETRGQVWVKGNAWYVRHEEASFRDAPFTVDRVINNAHAIDGSLWDVQNHDGPGSHR